MILMMSALAAAVLSQDAPPSETVRGSRAARMDTLITRAAAFGFSGQVLVVHHDSVILHKAWGWADRRRAVPMRLDTRLGIASMSKQFAGAAIHRQIAAGRMGLDDAIRQWIPDVPEDKQSITIRQVLSHTAGLAGGFADDFEDRSLDAMVRRVLARPLRWQPGARWGYSSEGYALLAAIVEQASGERWDDHLKGLFSLAGMQRSGTWRQSWREGDIAHGYQGARDNGSPASWPVNWRVAGGGDVISTAADLEQWHRALAGSRLIQAPALAAYFTPLSSVDSTTRYGSGLFHWTNQYGIRTIEHGGDTDLGYNGAFSRYPDSASRLIILTNVRDWFGRSGRAAIEAEVEALLLGGRPDTVALPPEARPLSSTERSEVRGTWQFDDGTRIHLIDDGAQLWAAAEGQEAVSLLTSRTGEQAEQLRHASERTRRLLDAWFRGDSAAVIAAFADSSAERQRALAESLQEFEKRNGVPREVKLLGSIVRPGAALTTVRVVSTRHEVYQLAFRWGGEGRGPLTAIFRGETWPVMIGVAREPDGNLLAYDMVAGRKGPSFRLSGQGANRRLTAGGVSARFLGSVGWAPD